MKEVNLEFEIQRSCTKIRNLNKQAADIQEKLKKLEKQLEDVKAGAQREIDRISAFGYKTARRDGKTETQAELHKKDDYNQDLYRQKLDLIKKFEPDLYNTMEKLMPKILRDEFLDGLDG